MKKRILSLLMTFCVAVCFVPTLAFANEAPTQTVVTIDVAEKMWILQSIRSMIPALS